MISIPFSIDKPNYLLANYHPCPIWPLVMLLDLSYTLLICLLLFSLNLTCRFSQNTIFQISCLFVIVKSHFVTFLFLWWGVASPLPNPHSGRLPLVSCPWLLIHYSHSQSPLESIFSIHNPRTHHAMVTGSHVTWIVANISRYLNVTKFSKDVLAIVLTILCCILVMRYNLLSFLHIYLQTNLLSSIK